MTCHPERRIPCHLSGAKDLLFAVTLYVLRGELLLFSQHGVQMCQAAAGLFFGAALHGQDAMKA